ncbi:hypothetical protein [Novosphingobium resinovorum]|uniref:hypothetical protein n=1 Tax=Novosphingobium resinovorum TaxID=158500 RepID=UPI002ED1D3ED|nr:hypothetical protein [Novosphingobium resinovorum]
MTVGTNTLRRRPRVERQVLRILRGGDYPSLDRRVAQDFAALREAARREGHVVLPAEAGYLSDGELMLLAGLAVSQRLVAPGCQEVREGPLAAVIAACAERLTGMGLRLYPLTLYAHRVRQAAS